jgi:glycosyltransferase involved in cell wall biosynthesis
MLADAGVAVVTYLRSSDEIDSFSSASKLGVPLQPIHGHRAVADVEKLIRTHRPDIMHLHNPYPLISLSVVSAAHRLDVAVVQTVHNHRHSCMRGSYFRDGQPCHLCQGLSTPWPAVLHGCYRDSHVQSIPMAIAFRSHRRDQHAVDRYIALTEPIAESLRASGLVSADQVVVRPNTVPDPGEPSPPGEGLLFVGRLSREKGIHVLLEAWRLSRRPFGTLTIVGDGPLRREVETAAKDPAAGLRVLGPLDSADVGITMRCSAAVIVPSTSPEALPLVVLEAFAHGRAVLASRSGGLAATVEPSVGILATADAEGMADGLRALAAADLSQLGAQARRRYEERYAPGKVISAQLEIYHSVLSGSAG